MAVQLHGVWLAAGRSNRGSAGETAVAFRYYSLQCRESAYVPVIGHAQAETFEITSEINVNGVKIDKKVLPALFQG